MLVTRMETAQPVCIRSTSSCLGIRLQAIRNILDI